MPPSPSLAVSLLTRCASARHHTSSPSTLSLLARALPCLSLTPFVPSCPLRTHQQQQRSQHTLFQQQHLHTPARSSLSAQAALTQTPLHRLPSIALLSLCLPTPTLLPSSARWFAQGHAGSKQGSASQPKILQACVQAVSKTATPVQLQQAMHQLAKRVQQGAKKGVKHSSRDRDSIVQAVHALPAQLLGQAARLPLHQLNSAQLSLLAWSIPQLVQLDSRAKSSSVCSLVDAMAQHAVRIQVMQHPAAKAWMNGSMLLLSVSKMGIMCRDSPAVRELFDEAAGQLPQLVRTKQPCVPQDVSSALLAFVYAEYPGDVTNLVTELELNLDWLMEGAVPQNHANTLWALAKLSCNPGASTVRKLANALAECSSDAKPQELSNTLWALAKLAELGCSPVASAVHKLAVALAERSSAAKPQELSNGLWALSELRWYDAVLYSKLAEGVLLKITSSAPEAVGQDFSNTMLSCAQSCHFDSSLDALAEWGSEQSLQNWTVQALSNVLFAWAILSATAGGDTASMRKLAQHLFAEASRRGVDKFKVSNDLGKLFSAHQEALHVCLPGGGLSDGELWQAASDERARVCDDVCKRQSRITSAVSTALRGVYDVQPAIVQRYHALLVSHPSCPCGVVIKVTDRFRDYLTHPPGRLFGKAALRMEQVKRGCDVLVLCDESEVLLDESESEAGRERVRIMLQQRIEQAVSEQPACL